MTRYIVQELVAGRWYTVRAFDTREEAKVFADWIGRKARIVERKSP
jgi:hypothetical protein